ncbi:MAG: GNAT family N-acetyltransferase [Atribacterota bacterium]|nr:GNAT family N-acetyltransferase [Atribacterota bacterium]
MNKNENNSLQKLTIRPAAEQDAPILLSLIKELAVFEKLADKVFNSEDAVRETLFGPKAYAEAEIAYWDDEPAGMVIFFHNYSTFLGKPGLYIEDLFVREKFRGRGIGKALFLECARLAKERNCGRMEWVVLDWNPARVFYEKMGAYPLTEWVIYRMDEDALQDINP